MNNNMNSDDLEGADIWGESATQPTAASGASLPTEDVTNMSGAPVDDETWSMSTSELRQRIHLLDNDIRVMRSDIHRITHESRAQKERIRENVEKVKMNKQLPYLVGNIVEILEPEAEDGK